MAVGDMYRVRHAHNGKTTWTYGFPNAKRALDWAKLHDGIPEVKGADGWVTLSE